MCLQFQSDLRQDADEELVDVVVERRRGLGVLGLVRVGHGLRIWWGKIFTNELHTVHSLKEGK